MLNGRAIAAVQKKLKALPKVQPQVSVPLVLTLDVEDAVIDDVGEVTFPEHK